MFWATIGVDPGGTTRRGEWLEVVHAGNHSLYNIGTLPIFIERFLLAFLSASAIAVIWANPMNLDRRQQVSAVIAIFAVAYFAAHTLWLHNEQKAKDARKPSDPSVIAAGSKAMPLPAVVDQRPTESVAHDTEISPNDKKVQGLRVPPTATGEPQAEKKQAGQRQAAQQPTQNRSVNIGEKATVIGSQITTGDNSPIINAEIPPPQFLFGEHSVKPVSGKKDTFVHSALLTVIYKSVVPELRVEAHHPGIQSFEAEPQRSGVSISGETGKREGYCFTTLTSVYGKYQMTAIVTGAGKVRFRVSK